MVSLGSHPSKYSPEADPTWLLGSEEMGLAWGHLGQGPRLGPTFNGSADFSAESDGKETVLPAECRTGTGMLPSSRRKCFT